MKKALAKNKKVTIDDLAIMVARGFESFDKKFTEVKKDIGEVKDKIGKVEEDIAVVRGDILTVGDRFVLKYEFYDLSTRVGLLEQKKKTKR